MMTIYEVRERIYDAFGEDMGTKTTLFMSYNGALDYLNSMVENADEVYEQSFIVKPQGEMKSVYCAFMDEDEFYDTSVRISINKKEVQP